LSRTITQIVPAHHSHRMSLEEFDRAEGQEGCLYELSWGIVSVSDVPHPVQLRLTN
jgi:hypothetical protein